MKKEIQDTIKVEYQLGYTDEMIERKCMEYLYGQCCSYGFIIPGTFEIIKRTPPLLSNMENGGKMYSIVNYKAVVVSLQRGEVIEGRITKVSPKLGSSADIIVDDTVVADVILPNDMQKPGIKVKEGDSVNIRIMISSYGVGWERIRGVGIVESKMDSYEEDEYIPRNGLNHAEVKNTRVLKNAKGGKVHVS
jgi:DNA-directed RNA polymerase subunit E'/Rpb7